MVDLFSGGCILVLSRLNSRKLGDGPGILEGDDEESSYFRGGFRRIKVSRGEGDVVESWHLGF